MSPVLTCTDYDTVNATCNASVWVEPSGGLPDLSVVNAHDLAYAIFMLWFVAFILRLLRRFADNLN